MAKIIESKLERIEKVKLVGKKYGPSRKGYSDKWAEWFEKGYFDILEELKYSGSMDNGYIGLMVWDCDNPGNHEYWIGVFVDLDELVPDSFDSVLVPDSDLIVYYIQGVDGNALYSKERECHKLFNETKQPLTVINGRCFAFERYNCPRFTKPNEKNEVILDYALLKK